MGLLACCIVNIGVRREFRSERLAAPSFVDEDVASSGADIMVAAN